MWLRLEFYKISWCARNCCCDANDWLERQLTLTCEINCNHCELIVVSCAQASWCECIVSRLSNKYVGCRVNRLVNLVLCDRWSITEWWLPLNNDLSHWSTNNKWCTRLSWSTCCNITNWSGHRALADSINCYNLELVVNSACKSVIDNELVSCS